MQDIINNSVNLFTRPCSAEEYDNLKLTVTNYERKEIKALDYDICGSLALKGNGKNFSGYSIFDLLDPMTGQKDFLQNILYNIFNVMTHPLTCGEYDELTLSATDYGKKNITAIKFDICGKSLLI